MDIPRRPGCLPGLGHLAGLERLGDQCPYTIVNGGNSLGLVRVNQRLAPDDFTAGSVSWESLGIFTVDAGTLEVRLSNLADGAVVADAVRIDRLSDTIVGVTVTPSSVTEGGTGTMAYTFRRSGGLSAPLTVNFAVGGTATFAADYAQSGAASFGSASGTVTFAAGRDTATVTVDPAADALSEGDETVVLAV